MTASVIGVIGGSGLYEIDGVEVIAQHDVETPFGAPSDSVVEGLYEGTRLLFLPRHGRGHRFTPSEVNYRANIWALKSLGCTDVLSVSAVGSMRENIAPGHVVLPDQFIDRTVGRERTFFGDGLVAHVAFADPVSERVRSALRDACERVGVTHHVDGSYVCIEGPQFSTRAESDLFRTWPRVVVIGMTNMPEARLAREAELPYATLALVTDYDCWHEGHDDVTVEAVMTVMRSNVKAAKAVILELAKQPPEGPCPSQNALQHAVMTQANLIPEQTEHKLSLLLSKYR
ncbi:MAG TPA: S-methyl-5'-thioadenosine phosphorylase [Myxococcales bacterium]|nr:S-methyl-5'-thioadenosine phosphorylase [Myxococcales bacterium]HAN31234.1 S-methyl-5'-thioadenosine phosphorylase [Myxococcales bacterium]